ncbi:MAG: hypothetical protein EXS32_06155 [Opitutus sp.]|nr:hypothetical protein [Opitutus sp.]
MVWAAAGALLVVACGKRADTPVPASRPVAPATVSAVAAAPAPVSKVIGRWLREDGGYVLEIRSGATGGVLDAGYFNPKPIHVSRAAWYEGGGSLQVLVELNDVGYPGATYVLRHNPQTDRLVGQYTQPSLQQSFDIEFVREPKP